MYLLLTLLFSFLYNQQSFETNCLEEDIVQKRNFYYCIPSNSFEGYEIQFQVLSNPTGKQVLNTYTYSWDLGDKRGKKSGSNIFYTYRGQGPNNGYTVSVVINDENGQIIEEFSKFISIANVAPTLKMEIFPSIAKEGDNLVFEASHTDPGIIDQHTYYWDFGDGSPIRKRREVYHSFKDNGKYEVTTIVKDDDDDADTIKQILIVENVNPKIESLQIPTVANEGEKVKFNSNIFDPGKNDTFTLKWIIDTKDTVTTVKKSIEYTFPDNGNISIELIAIDKDSGADTIKQFIQVNNREPSAEIKSKRKAMEGDLVQFEAFVVDPGIDDTHSYEWMLGDGTIKKEKNFKHAYRDNGTYVIQLIATDDDGAKSNIIKKNIIIENIAPTVNITFPITAFEGDTLLLEAEISDSGANDSLTFNWSFGEGKLDSTIISKYSIIKNKSSSVIYKSTAKYVYSDNGSYPIYFTATDDDGAKTSKSSNLNILNKAPVISGNIPKTANEGDEIEFEIYLDYDPGSNDTHTLMIDYGDGESDQFNIHSYKDNGEYEVMAVLMDDDGGSDTLQSTIIVYNLPPIISIDLPDQSEEGKRNNFSASFKDPGKSDTHSYLWKFGNGDTDTNLVTNYTFNDNGVFDVKIIITDDDGGSDSISQSIDILNIPPTISASLVSSSKVQIPEKDNQKELDVITQTIDISKTIEEHSKPSGDEGASISFISSVQDPGKLDSHTYTWDFGDGISSNDSITSHIYTKNGDFNISLIVSDDDGGTDTLNQNIVISNITPAMAATIFSVDTTYQNILVFPLTDFGSADGNQYIWDFGDGGLIETPLTSYGYKNSGSYLISAKVKDKKEKIDLVMKNLKISNNYPAIDDLIEEKNLIESDSEKEYLSKNLYSISSYRTRSIDPNSFPTFVFTINNYSNEKHKLNFNTIIPENWKIITFSYPDFAEPNKKSRARMTLEIPHNEIADDKYQVQLVSRIGDFDHVASILSSINVEVNEKPQFIVDVKNRTKEIFLDKKEFVSYKISNTGNVTDNYIIEPSVPEGWEIIRFKKNVRIQPNKSKKIDIYFSAPKEESVRRSYSIKTKFSSKKMLDKVGKWHESIQAEEGYCSDSLSTNKEQCIELREWTNAQPEVAGYCNEKYWDNKNDCIKKSVWNFPVEAKPGFCSTDPNLNKEECQNSSGAWMEEVKAVESYCDDGISKKYIECINPGEWTDAIEGKEGYCSDNISTAKIECETKRVWIDAINGEEAYCSDNISTTKIECENAEGVYKELKTILHPNIKRSTRTKESIWAHLPVNVGFNVSELPKNSYPAGVAFVKINNTQLGKSLVGLDYQHRIYAADLDSIPNTKLETFKFNYSNPKWGFLLGDNYLNNYPLFYNKRSSFNIDGLTDVIFSRGLKTNFNITIGQISLFKGISISDSLDINFFALENIPYNQLTTLSTSALITKKSGTYLSNLVFERSGISNGQVIGVSSNINNNIDGMAHYLHNLNLYNIADSSVSYSWLPKKIDLNLGIFYSGDNYNGANKGQYGTNFILKSNWLNKLYNWSKIKVSKNNLYDNYPIFINESFSDCGYDQVCENLDDVNGNGIWDQAEEYSDENLDGYYNIGENFVDSNNNGVWDNKENFNDENGNGIWDAPDYGENNGVFDMEEFTDTNNNGLWDEGEEFTDSNNNSLYDQEEFTDLNKNSSYDNSVFDYYLQKSTNFEIISRLFYITKDKKNISSGIKLININYDNLFNERSFQWYSRVDKSYSFGKPQLNFVYDYEDRLFLSPSHTIDFLLQFDGSTRFFNYKIAQGFNQTLGLKMSSYNRMECMFNIKSMLFSIYMYIENTCPVCNDEEPVNVVSNAGLFSRLNVDLFGFKADLMFGLNKPYKKDLTVNFSISPKMTKNKAMINVPVPFVGIKGRYKGIVYIDKNNNGNRDYGETGISNILFFLNGVDAITDGSGYFEFSAVEEGEFLLKFDPETLPIQYQFTEEINIPVTIRKGETQYVEIPLTVLGKVSGKVFYDKNENSLLDNNEITYPQIRVVLQNKMSKEIEVFSDRDGYFSFNNLFPGKYNLIIDSDYLPERKDVTFAKESKILFTKLGWPIEITHDDPQIRYNLPVIDEKVPIKWDVVPDGR